MLLRGTFRCFSGKTQKTIADQITRLVNATCEGFGLSAKIKFNPENPDYPVTFNAEAKTELALQAAMAVAGADGVDSRPAPCMGSEDFAFMLQEKPGCYVWIGNGSSENGYLLHNPNYDFKDEILPIGTAYWVKLVSQSLKAYSAIRVVTYYRARMQIEEGFRDTQSTRYGLDLTRETEIQADCRANLLLIVFALWWDGLSLKGTATERQVKVTATT